MRDFVLVIMLMFGCSGCITLGIQTPVGGASAQFGDKDKWWKPDVELDVNSGDIKDWAKEKYDEWKVNRNK